MSTRVGPLAVGAAVLAAALTLSACSVPVLAEGSKMLPDNTLQDWVTYGDYLVEFTVQSEARVEPTQEEKDRGEGEVGRTVDIAITSAGWSRPSLSSTIPSLPSNRTLNDGGWVFHGSDEQPLQIDGQAPLTVGKTFLAVMAYSEVTPNVHKWVYIRIVPEDGGIVNIAKPDSPAEIAVQHLSGQAVAGLMKTTPPDKKALKFMDADPVVRWHEVAAQQ